MSFETDMAAWKGDITRELVKGIKDGASQIYGNLVEHSPVPGKAPYSIGTFVKSHRIGIGSEDNSFVLPQSNKEPDFDSVSKAMAEISKLDGANDLTDIHISNSCLHAEDVEFIGWSSTPPYWPFQKTEGTMEVVMQQALDRI